MSSEAGVRVKICGFTSRDDVLRAVDMGVDAVGFVFAPGSRRRAHPAEVERAVADLPAFVTAVGVFQDQDAGFVRDVVDSCGLALAQLHGSEDMEFIGRLGCRSVLKALYVTRRSDIDRLADYWPLTTFLLDGAPHEVASGPRRAFNRTWAVEAKRYGRIVLAGGLDPDNVADAVREVRPWAVDAASGTELRPGVKDRDRMRLFIKRAREGSVA